MLAGGEGPCHVLRSVCCILKALWKQLNVCLMARSWQNDCTIELAVMMAGITRWSKCNYLSPPPSGSAAWWDLISSCHIHFPPDLIPRQPKVDRRQRRPSLSAFTLMFSGAIFLHDALELTHPNNNNNGCTESKGEAASWIISAHDQQAALILSGCWKEIL